VDFGWRLSRENLMRIEIERLHFTYPGGVEALRGVSLTVEAGQQVALVGQNGSGKTTLVKHLNGLLRPGRGSVRIGEWLTTDHSVAQLARRVGYVFQNPDEQLFKNKVAAEVTVGPANLGFSPARTRELVNQALALLDLTGYADTNPHDLTATWRKRVAIASVLAMDTPIVVLDEPTTGQDGRFGQRLGQIMVSLRQQGKTVLAISHDIDFVAENFERIIVMGQGQLLLDGAPAEVFQQAEILAGSYVELPQMTRLGGQLGVDQVVYTVDNFLKAYRQQFGPG
jgi:energy-coupling factor transport system ATP-binding protein